MVRIHNFNGDTKAMNNWVRTLPEVDAPTSVPTSVPTSAEEDFAEYISNKPKEVQVKQKPKSKRSREKDEDEPPSDLALAKGFADLHSEKVKYCADQKKYYTYNTNSWNRDKDKVAENLIIDYLESNNVEETYKVRDVTKLIQDKLHLNPELLDSNINLLNLQNGTLNLSTLKIQPSTPDDLISKTAGCAYDPKATCDLWRRVLLDVHQGDESVIEYFNRVVYYALTGKVDQKVFFLLYGATTNNGKSTIINTLMKVFGEYAQTAPASLITRKKTDGSDTANDALVRTKGARLISVNEPPRNTPMDEALIKQITGGDTITARGLFQENVEFKPTGTLLINTNYLPHVNDKTIFTSDRVKVIPYNKSFSREERDLTVADRLQTPESLSGILNWILSGKTNYDKIGLDSPPQAVIDATAEYYKDSDYVSRLIEECFTSDPNSKTSNSEIKFASDNWLNQEGINKISQSALTNAFKERGFEKYKSGGERGIKGIKLSK